MRKTTFLKLFFFALCAIFINSSNMAQDVTINLNSEKQTIRGFGGCDFPRWIGALTPGQVDTAFGNGVGQLGLSILRININHKNDNNQWNRNVANAQRAINNHGAIVFASPWTPPVHMKDNNSHIRGRLRTNMYEAYANHLKDYYNYMNANGVPLYAISVQNEPNYAATHESCDWTPSEMRTFLDNNASVIPTKVMGPETFNPKANWQNALESAPELDILATHAYGGSAIAHPTTNKEQWMTEKHFNGGVGQGQGSGDFWPQALLVGEEMNEYLVAGYTAYIHWYIRRHYSLIKEDGNISKRGYVSAHYSKFIRPGAVRLDATDLTTNGVTTSAYKSGNSLVIVAINNNNSSKNINLNLFGNQVASMTKYETTSSSNINNVGTLPGGTSISNTLAAYSITTFVGEIGPNVTDDIISVNTPTSIIQGSTIDVDVDYSISANRKITVRLESSSYPYTAYVSENKNVLAGTSNTTFNLLIPTDVTFTNDAYQIQTYITTTTGGWNQRFDHLTKSNIYVIDDDIISVSAPTSVIQGETISVDVDYSATTDRKITFRLQLGSPPYTEFLSVDKDVLAGSSTTTFNLTIPSDLPIGNNAYQIQPFITTSSGGWNQRFDHITKSNIDASGDSIWLEAECGTVGNLFDVINDGTASNNEYVTVQSGNTSSSAPPAGSDAQITYPFNISDSGSYKLWARVIAPIYTDDSFWIRVDNGMWFSWNNIAPNSTNWTWDDVSDYTFTPGNHTLTVAYREDGALLDKLYFTKAEDTPVGAGSDALTCNNSASRSSLKEKEQVNEIDKILMYPNPVSEVLSIYLPGKENKATTLSIYNIRGSLVKTITAKNGKNNVDVNNLSAGLYFMVFNHNNKSYKRKFVKE